MKKKNLLSIRDLDKQEIEYIFEIAELGDRIFDKYENLLRKKVLCSLFFQPSTRTQFSFQSSFIKLGGSCMACTDIEQTRSGKTYCEPLDDMARMLNNYCDMIVIRSSHQNDVELLAKGADIPVVSAGSGIHEHPTQALIDIFAIKKLCQGIDNNHILIIGTPPQRTINSLLLGLSMWDNIIVSILCQKETFVSNSYSKINNIAINYVHSWEEIISSNKYRDVSVIYVAEILAKTYDAEKFNLSEKLIKQMKNNPVILSPLPRTAQLPQNIDSIESARYYYQAKQGAYIRAALYVYYFI